jgi:hypothetical protein
MLLSIVSFLLVVLAWATALGFVPFLDDAGEVVVRQQDALWAIAGVASLLALLAVWHVAKGRRMVVAQEAARREVAGRVEHLETEAKELSDELGALRADRQGMLAAHAREVEELRRALKLAEERAEEGALQRETSGRETLHLLSRLQEKGRFLDFLMQDIGSFSDQQVGAASRFVHDGCRAVVREYLELAPVYEQNEGSSVTVAASAGGHDVRFIGKSATTFPVTGRLVHRGWRVTKAQLPQVTTTPLDAAAAAILAPAQVELS